MTIIDLLIIDLSIILHLFAVVPKSSTRGPQVAVQSGALKYRSADYSIFADYSRFFSKI